jgi:hypothetical protein
MLDTNKWLHFVWDLLIRDCPTIRIVSSRMYNKGEKSNLMEALM